MFFKLLVYETWLFLLIQGKHFHHLNSFYSFDRQKMTPRELGKERKKESVYKSQNLPTILTIHHNHGKPYKAKFDILLKCIRNFHSFFYRIWLFGDVTFLIFNRKKKNLNCRLFYRSEVSCICLLIKLSTISKF